ncbi:hypothetical protein ACIF80_36620 [Streptomyces sp. NPDC085927]|uniref:hypothetical protein n=1 Tax=Streptomyces sp. NPDC085927 TaxID=3365738 RepID=UPI0037D9719D
MRWDERTRAYVERRTGEGLAKKDIMRCLKRHVAREVYRVLMKSVHTTRTAGSPTQSDLTEAA